MEEINQATDQLINSIPEMIYSVLWNGIKFLAPIFAPAVLLVIVGTLAFGKWKINPIVRIALIILSLLILVWMLYQNLTH